jgi:DNA-damage-inducible protein D
MSNEQNTERRVHTSPFDAIRHQNDQYGEYWSGKELYKLLGYSSWERFKGTIERAKVACEEAKQAVSDHFHIDVKMITAGKGAKRKSEDIYLSRYACYLVLQNADPNGKPLVGLAQTYFAVQTRRQELADDAALAALPEEQKRLILRSQMAILNQQLATAARGAGVIRPEDFSLFQNHGYRGLYGGETENAIHARKGLKPQDKILDYMGSDELAYNSFRASLTKQKIEREQIQEKGQANTAHYEMGREVRETIIRTGATLPEDLPTPEKSIQQLQREEQKRIEQQQQPSLFDDLPEE